MPLRCGCIHPCQPRSAKYFYGGQKYFSPEVDKGTNCNIYVAKASTAAAANAFYYFYAGFCITRKCPSPVQAEALKGGDAMYTEYGYLFNGVLYATIEEALASRADD